MLVEYYNEQVFVIFVVLVPLRDAHGDVHDAECVVRDGRRGAEATATHGVGFGNLFRCLDYFCLSLKTPYLFFSNIFISLY